MQWRDDTAMGNGVRLHIRRVVDPPAPPVLLLHGLGVGGSIWQAFARRLLPDLAAVAPDLRGHGRSDAPVTGYTPADYAADLVEVLTDSTLNLDPPVAVVGHSLGGLVGLELAEVRPDLVRWLAVLDPPLDPAIPNPEVAAVYRLRHAPDGELEAYLLSRNPGGGQLLADSLASLFRQASDAVYETFLRPKLDRESRSRAAEAVRRAAAILVPCLVLQADPAHGGLLGDDAARAFVDSLPDGRLLKIPAATHAMHASHPAEVAAAILAFNRSSG